MELGLRNIGDLGVGGGVSAKTIACAEINKIFHIAHIIFAQI